MNDIVSQELLVAYLADRHQQPIHLKEILALGGPVDPHAEIKGFGYGSPTLVAYTAGKTDFKIVIRPVQRNGYGRERKSDRIAEVWRDFGNFGLLPQHVPAVDIIGVKPDKRLVSLNEVDECLLVTDFAEGEPYATDLVRLGRTGVVTALDDERAQVLATYLVKIHRIKHADPLLWRRRLRDLVGHGEGIMGIIDGYEDVDFVTPHTLRSIEDTANHWRWRLKERTDRLSQVHGDFHPFNILFRDGIDFSLIDRSRGTWGAPEDDLAALSINYLFFSLHNQPALVAPFKRPYEIFWQTYLYQSGDLDILDTIAPWLAWRALVLASPTWYPNITNDVRQRLISLASNVLASKNFSWHEINHYLGSR